MDRINEWLEWLAQALSAGLRWEYRVTRNDSIGFELVDATLSCADSDMPIVNAWGVVNDGRIRVEFDLSLNMPEMFVSPVAGMNVVGNLMSLPSLLAASVSMPDMPLNMFSIVVTLLVSKCSMPKPCST